MSGLRVFDAASLQQTIAAASVSLRRRANLNVHATLDEPIQRMLNVFQPGSYVRPHRHEAGRYELFLALAGKAAVLTFDDAGCVAETAVLAPGDRWAVELPGAVWHTVVSLAAGTALFEVKPGPYRPLEGSDFAAWAPDEGTAGAATLLHHWEALAAAAAITPRG